MESSIDLAQAGGGGPLSANAMFSRCLRGLSPARDPEEPRVNSAVVSFHPVMVLRQARVAGGASAPAPASPEMRSLRPRLHERRGWARRWSL